MKSVIWLMVFFVSFILPVTGADFTAEQWKQDLALYQKYMSESPQDYLNAVKLVYKWRECPEDKRKSSGADGMSREALTAVANNLYRVAAKELCDNYVVSMITEPIQSAELAMNTRNFFQANPEILAEFASANGSTPESMKETIDQATRKAFNKTFELCAAEYSRLRKEGKVETANQLSLEWSRILSGWNAANSGLPKAFGEFAGVNPQQALDQVRAIEKDLELWNNAVDEGDSKTALALTERWVQLEKQNPGQARQLNYIFHASDGAGPSDKTAWEKTLRAETYARLWEHDLREYRMIVAEGRKEEALARIAAWKTIFAGPYGAEVSVRLGLELPQITSGLKAEEEKITGMDPSLAGGDIGAFRKELGEVGKNLRLFEGGAAVGSEAWYDAAARVGDLCEIWGKRVRENPPLAGEIMKGTGIDFQKASDALIAYILDKTVTDSATKFNSYQAAGQYHEALSLVKRWQEYLDKHPLITAKVKEKHGNDFAATLERVVGSLSAMATASAGTPATKENQ